MCYNGLIHSPCPFTSVSSTCKGKEVLVKYLIKALVTMTFFTLFVSVASAQEKSLEEKIEDLKVDFWNEECEEHPTNSHCKVFDE